MGEKHREFDPMPLKIDFLIAQNLYQSTSHFSFHLAEGLKKQGVRCRLLSAERHHFSQTLLEIGRSPPDLTCSFSDLTLGEGIPFGSQWDIPHLSFLIDPAIYFLHHAKGKNSLVTSVDQEDVRFLEKFGGKKVLFFPHAAEAVEVITKERPFFLSYFGTCLDYKKIEEKWKKKYSSQFYDSLMHGADCILSKKNQSILEVVQDLPGFDLLPLHHEMDLYIGGKERILLLQSLASLGVHIWGTGPWKKYVPTAHLHRPVPFQKALQLMEQSQIIINSSPRFKKGTHERLFYGPTRGAAVLTAHHPVSFFQKDQSILTYEYGDWNLLRDYLAPYLSRPSLTLEVAKNARESIMKDHTWDHRAKQLTDWLHL